MKNTIKYSLDYTKRSTPRQTILPLDYGLMIPEDEPVRLLDLIFEEVDYKEIQGLYSSKGRKSSIPPRILTKLYIFAMMEGIYSTRAIQRQCQVNLQYKWLLEGYPAPSHMTIQRFFARLTLPVIENLFIQVLNIIANYDSITFDEVFIDGTKIEANANRYTFVWRKSIEKQLIKLVGKLNALKQDVFQLTREDMTSYNDELVCIRLAEQMRLQRIQPVYGKGCRKTPIQRLYDRAQELLHKRLSYEEHLAIMGPRNSYSKTDRDATFMRMKEDHMMNGQLKPAYNVQVATHSEYIVGVGMYANPTDTKTLIPFVKDLERLHKRKFGCLVADAGYDSEENLEWAYTHDYTTCIKPQNHEQAKKRKWREAIGRPENMTYDETIDSYTCVMGQELYFSHIATQISQSGYRRKSRVYTSQSCDGCPRRLECQPSRSGMPCANNKRIFIATRYQELQAKNQEVFGSELGSQLRVNRSIQIEGVFGVMKQDYNFRRLFHKGKTNVHKEMYLLALGFNLRKLHNRNICGRLYQRLFPLKNIA